MNGGVKFHTANYFDKLPPHARDFTVARGLA